MLDSMHYCVKLVCVHCNPCVDQVILCMGFAIKGIMDSNHPDIDSRLNKVSVLQTPGFHHAKLSFASGMQLR